MHGGLREQCRIAAGREPQATAAVIDSQSVKAAEEVARAGRGYDVGKKINGRKRHIAVDTIGPLLTVPLPPHRPRLRTPARTLRDHRLLGHDHHHEQAPRPPLTASPAARRLRFPDKFLDVDGEL